MESGRPAPLQLPREAPWPALQLQAQAAEAEQVLLRRPSTEIRVVTWNVWFDEYFGPQRQSALLLEVLKAAPDVVCLQEVLPKFADAVRNCQPLRRLYAISENDVGPYGTMLLVRHDMRPQFDSQALESHMGRTLLFATCGDRVPELLLVTTHLESLNTREVRRMQLNQASVLMRSHARAVLCGDFNFDDTKTWGDWRRKSPALWPSQLENHVLKEQLPGFVDAWREVHPEDPGYTFDGVTNPACVKDPGERMRYDRLVSRRGGLLPKAAALLGTEPIDGDGSQLGVRPSDHFGLQVDLAVGAEEAACEHGGLAV